MDFTHSARSEELRSRLSAFMDAQVYPKEGEHARQLAAGDRWQPLPLVEALKREARAAGLWNLFLPDAIHGAGLSNLEYAPLAELMGRVPWASEVFNCSAPDTGNMETLARYGSEAQKARWLEPLLAGQIRSAIAMTEPQVASSDATNIESRIVRDGDDYLVSGRKWFISGAGDPRCAVFLFMGKTDPQHPQRHRQQSMILIPRQAPGITVHRALPVFGYDDAPHGHMEVSFDEVRVPADQLLLGEGRGFEIAQGRLGPGRIHHCMRLLGLGERALELMCRRSLGRVAFGKPLAEQGVTRERIAQARILLDQARLLTLHAAWMMDTQGNKRARQAIAMIKVAAPQAVCQVLDWAIQAHGAAGMSDDFPLAYAYTTARWIRLADGPDEVHREAIAKLELARHRPQAGDSAAPSPPGPEGERKPDRS